MEGARGAQLSTLIEKRTPADHDVNVPRRRVVVAAQGIDSVAIGGGVALRALSMTESYTVDPPAERPSAFASAATFGRVASKRRASMRPSTTYKKTPSFEPDSGTNTTSEFDRKSGDPGAEAGRSVGQGKPPAGRPEWIVRDRESELRLRGTQGQQCAVSPIALSSSVAGSTDPPSAPFAETRQDHIRREQDDPPMIWKIALGDIAASHDRLEHESRQESRQSQAGSPDTLRVVRVTT